MWSVHSVLPSPQRIFAQLLSPTSLICRLKNQGYIPCFEFSRRFSITARQIQLLILLAAPAEVVNQIRPLHFVPAPRRSCTVAASLGLSSLLRHRLLARHARFRAGGTTGASWCRNFRDPPFYALPGFVSRIDAGTATGGVVSQKRLPGARLWQVGPIGFCQRQQSVVVCQSGAMHDRVQGNDRGLAFAVHGRFVSCASRRSLCRCPSCFRRRLTVHMPQHTQRRLRRHAGQPLSNEKSRPFFPSPSCACLFALVSAMP